MKHKCKRGLATLLAVLLLCSALPPGALATDVNTSSSAAATIDPDVIPSAAPDSTAAPEPTAATSAVPTDEPPPTASPEVTASPDPTASATPDPSTEPEATLAPEASPEPTENPETGTPPVEITDMFTTAEATLGDTVELYVEVDRENGVSYQWQRLYTPPLEEEAAAQALYPYGEGESTDYYFPLEGTTESEVLAHNPEAVWPGIEIYYDQLAKLPMVMDEDATPPEIHIENGTHNYVLEPVETLSAADDMPTGEWTDLKGETSNVYRHEVTPEDEHSSYRCVITVEPEAPVETEQAEVALPADSAAEANSAPKSTVAPEASEAPANEDLPASDEFPAEEAKSDSGGAQGPESANEPTVLISDSMYLSLSGQSGQNGPDQTAAPRLLTAADAPAVALSADNQWLTGLDRSMEYITKDTYDAQGCEVAGNAYWTRINSGARPDGSKYRTTNLTDGKMEVLSAWYGRTIYVRYQGQTGPGTEVKIPAYTDTNYQTGKSTLYKKAIKLFNAWVPDTGGSFYAAYLRTALSNGNTPDGGHITIDTVSLEEFNKIPTWHLTNAEGDYIYDAVIIGAATNDEPDLSGAAAWELARYIGEGYGFMIGHDMMYGYGGVNGNPDYTPDPGSTVTPYYVPNTHTNGHYNMAWLMGQNTLYSSTSPYAAASMILCTGDYQDKSTLYGDNKGISSLQILKSSAGDPLKDVESRIPTNYPYSQNSFGVPFTSGMKIDGTATHTNQQMAYGTIWLNYASNSMADMGLGRLLVDTKADGLTGTNNFYLTTNGNFAMSQIGHSKNNKDTARIDECYILANTMFYISQRQQCQVCQSQQGGNDQVHMVRRISSAEELAKLRDQDKYWFTYPLDGCYMLAADIHLPADWQPIQGFDGHFDADGHSITFSSSLAAPNRTVFAQASSGGWNLGTDKTQGVTTISAGTAKTTGVARVVGYLAALELADSSLEGYRVEVTGTDGKTYSCVTNLDGKYVISNLPCTGVMAAYVYDRSGKQITALGQLAVTIPDGTGMITPEGRSQDFWLSSETTAIYPLDYTALPPEPATRWVGQSADFTATILTGSEYPADKIVWQYKTKNGDWTDLAGSSVEYKVTHLGQIDTGDPLTTGTQTKLTLQNLPLGLSGTEVRIRYTGNRDMPKVSGSAAVTVKKPQLQLDMSGDQTVWVLYEDRSGNRLDYALPADQWPARFGQDYPVDYGALNNGNNVAEYTSTILYLPELDGRSTPQIQWTYRTGNNTNTETPLGNSKYDESSHTWNTSLDYSALKALYPQLVFSLVNSTPVACDQDGTDNLDGEWRKVVSTLTVDGASTKMDVGNTHFFFRCAAVNEYGSGQSLYEGKATSADAGLSVQYTLDIVPGEGSPRFGSGNATWSFPQLRVYAPNGLRTAVLSFYAPGHNSNNRVQVAAGNPYGISVHLDAGDYVIFKSASGDLISQEDWQAFFRDYVSYLTYDAKDSVTEDISWYVSENDEADRFKVVLFDGSTSGWSGSGVPYGPRPAWGQGSPGSWGGYNNTISYKGISGGSQLIASLTSGSDGRGSWDGTNYYNFRGWNMTLQRTFDATSLARLYLDAYITSPSSSIIYNSIVVTGSQSLTISNPGTGKVQTTTGGLKSYDISGFTGNVTLTFNSNVITQYALNGSRNMNSEYIGRTETAAMYVRTAYALAKDFERTNRSAIKYSELWANAVKTAATVTLTPDPNKVYDGQPSAATLTVTAADGSTGYILANATVSYYRGGQLVSSGKPDDPSGCSDQGSYKAVATFGQAVFDRYALSGVAVDGTVSAEFAITPRPLTLRSRYLDDPSAPGNLKMYDAATTARISNIKVSNIVAGDPVTLDKSSYAGTYATAAAGEQLTAEGKVQPDRYAKLTETWITRTEAIALTNDPQGNYYIAAEEYSGAIYRRPISAFVGAFSSVYGDDILINPQTAPVYSASEGGEGTDLEISALVGGDTLTIDPAKSRFVLPAGVDKTSPTGNYSVEYEGLTEANYPVLSNYIVWYQPGPLVITPRPLTVHSRYLDGPAPRNLKAYDGTTAAVIGDILIDNIVPGDSVWVDQDSYAGAYATAQAGEALAADGTFQPDRLAKLTENAIVRTAEMQLINDPDENYYIAEEDYSGAIYRADLTAQVAGSRTMYGEAVDYGAAAKPWHDTQPYGAATTASEGCWLTITGLQAEDTLTLDAALSGFAIEDAADLVVDGTTPVGKYTLRYTGLNEANYPALANYAVAVLPGTQEVYPREIRVTVQNEDRYVEQTSLPQTNVTFEMLNGDGKDYTPLGSNGDTAYADMPLQNGDSVQSILLVKQGAEPGAPLPEGAGAQLVAEIEDAGVKKTLYTSHGIPLVSDWYAGCPARYLDLAHNPSLQPCAWCAAYHGFELGTDHWQVTGYATAVNQSYPQLPTLETAWVENPLGQRVQNYALNLVAGTLTVHPELRFQLSATVPMYVCMYGYAGDGEVVEPTNYGITNYSNGKIEIKDIETGSAGWHVVDKPPLELLRGEISMKLWDTQLVTGANTPRNRWIIEPGAADTGTELPIPLSCHIAGGNVNDRAETFVTRVTYTLAEYGVTVPGDTDEEVGDVIDGKPVTQVPGQQ